MCQPVSMPGVVRGSRKTSGWRPKRSRSRAKLRFRRARLAGSFRICTTPNAADSSDGSKFQPDLVEDEQVVVLDAVEVAEEAIAQALAAPNSCDLAAPAPAPQQQAAIGQRLVVEAHHSAGAGGGDDVRRARSW